ncbi:MAG: BMP family lipoprotein [Actinomycetes bacterium]
MRRVNKLASAIFAAALVLTACGGDDTAEPTPGEDTTSAAAKSDLKVGLAYDIGGRGDQSFNDSAAAGLDKAKDELGIETQEAEAATGEAESAKEERLRQLADAGYNPIIAVGFAYSGSLAKVAPEYPDVNFAIIDDAGAKGDNIANLTFAEHEGSFLVGVIAALKSQSGTVGFVGGVNVPLINKFEAGFKAGVEAGKAGTKVESTYLTQPPDFSGFTDAAKGKTAAAGLIDGGADVVYHAAGGSGGGVFEAAQAGNAKAIGVDSDQYNTADAAVKDVIISSMLKKLDVAVFDFITAVNDDNFKPGETVYDLKVDGVGYSTTGGQVDDIASQVEEFKAKIVSGEITVPSS